MTFTSFFYQALAVYVLIVSLPIILSIVLVWYKAKIRQQEQLKKKIKRKFITQKIK